MIFSKLFKRKKRKYENENYDEEYSATHYADIEAQSVVQEVYLSDEAASRHYVVDLCEQMMNVSRELEDAKKDYQLITNYLNDIQIIEELPLEPKAEITECAGHIAKLGSQKDEFLKTEHQLSESQYAQLQMEEDELPSVIKRLQSNETYLDAIKRDLHYLEGEKLQWGILKSESRQKQKLVRTLSIALFILFGTIAALLFVLDWAMQVDTQIPMMLLMAVTAIMAVLMFVIFQNAGRDIEVSEIRRNQAVTLENHVKFKYVNIKNAVDYVCEKYHVRDSKELVHYYDLYLEERRQQERFRQTNADLEFYSEQLIQLLRQARLYDPAEWVDHTNALLDAREMVELKHDLFERRKKARTRVEFNVNTINNMKKEALRHVDRLGDKAAQMQQIINRIEEISASLS